MTHAKNEDAKFRSGGSSEKSERSEAGGPAITQGADGRTEDIRPGRSLKPYVPPAPDHSRASRFTLLAAVVALAAGIGAVSGSIGYTGVERLLTAEPPRKDILNHAHGLKTEITQLHEQMKTVSEQIGTLRNAVTSASSHTGSQLARFGEALERAEKRAAAAAQMQSQAQARAHVPPQGPADVTGALPRPGVVPARPIPGWIVRRVYDGVALIEGRDGIIEAEPGALIPGIGRVQEIKRDRGRWLVVTSQGLITSR